MYRNHNLFELCELLKFFGSDEPNPEALIWYLMTGNIPNEEQVTYMIGAMNRRSKIPKDVETLLSSLGKDVHPMTQFSMGVLALQKDSKFAKAYRGGVNKKIYWETYYDDSLDLMAKLPRSAAIIYNNIYRDGKPTPENRSDYDMARNFANMLGLDNKEFYNLVSHYLVLHR